ncbi:MAG: hypothetical protein LBP22_10450 [Deltaproteobacteria bacterium]|jgi:hypothetical protein|nr:hypothetical protein [Deltaproteobacteria bacterium]
MKHYAGQPFDPAHDLQVIAEHFYGIDCDDFAVEIATAAMWSMEHRMNKLLAEKIGTPYDRLKFLHIFGLI